MEKTKGKDVGLRTEQQHLLLLLGSGMVGKTAFRDRLVARVFSLDRPYRATIGCEIIHLINGQSGINVDNVINSDKGRNGHRHNSKGSLSIGLCDTPGQVKFRPLARPFFHMAEACILMYDVTNPESVRDLPLLVYDFVRHSHIKDIHLVPMVLVATKTDMFEDRIVSKRTGRFLAFHLKSILLQLAGLQPSQVHTSSLLSFGVSQADLLINIENKNNHTIVTSKAIETLLEADLKATKIDMNHISVKKDYILNSNESINTQVDDDVEEEEEDVFYKNKSNENLEIGENLNISSTTTTATNTNDNNKSSLLNLLDSKSFIEKSFSKKLNKKSHRHKRNDSFGKRKGNNSKNPINDLKNKFNLYKNNETSINIDKTKSEIENEKDEKEEDAREEEAQEEEAKEKYEDDNEQEETENEIINVNNTNNDNLEESNLIVNNNEHTDTPGTHNDIVNNNEHTDTPGTHNDIVNNNVQTEDVKDIIKNKMETVDKNAMNPSLANLNNQGYLSGFFNGLSNIASSTTGIWSRASIFGYGSTESNTANDTSNVNTEIKTDAGQEPIIDNTNCNLLNVKTIKDNDFNDINESNANYDTNIKHLIKKYDTNTIKSIGSITGAYLTAKDNINNGTDTESLSSIISVNEKEEDDGKEENIAKENEEEDEDEDEDEKDDMLFLLTSAKKKNLSLSRDSSTKSLSNLSVNNIFNNSNNDDNASLNSSIGLNYNNDSSLSTQSDLSLFVNMDYDKDYQTVDIKYKNIPKQVDEEKENININDNTDVDNDKDANIYTTDDDNKKNKEIGNKEINESGRLFGLQALNNLPNNGILNSNLSINNSPISKYTLSTGSSPARLKKTSSVIDVHDVITQLPYFEISSKTGSRIDDIMSYLFKSIAEYRSYKRELYNRKKHSLMVNKKGKQSYLGNGVGTNKRLKDTFLNHSLLSSLLVRVFGKSNESILKQHFDNDDSVGNKAIINKNHHIININDNTDEQELEDEDDGYIEDEEYFEDTDDSNDIDDRDYDDDRSLETDSLLLFSNNNPRLPNLQDYDYQSLLTQSPSQSSKNKANKLNNRLKGKDKNKNKKIKNINKIENTNIGFLNYLYNIFCCCW